jgi:hypothetical protein
MKKRCRNEVEQLHMFFQDWFIGAAEDTDDNFARVAAVLAPDFMLISPRGHVHDRDDILGIIRDAHGQRAEGFRIWTSDFDVRVAQGPLCVATYREWQEADGEQTCRLSSVVFREHDSTPNRVEWTHLHETWLPLD